MEPLFETQTNKLFVATDVIQTAKELQTHLSGLEGDDQLRHAVEAMELLGDPRELYGSKKVYIHALGASVFRGVELMSMDEEVYHGTYIADSYLKAHFSRFSFIRSDTVSGLCLSLFQTEILQSQSNPEFHGETIRSGVYVPIHAVETVLAA